MATGLGVLRLSPVDFWAMTVPELAAACRGASGVTGGVEPPARQGLDELMMRFPDMEGSGDDR